MSVNIEKPTIFRVLTVELNHHLLNTFNITWLPRPLIHIIHTSFSFYAFHFYFFLSYSLFALLVAFEFFYSLSMFFHYSCFLRYCIAPSHLICVSIPFHSQIFVICFPELISRVTFPSLLISPTFCLFLSPLLTSFLHIFAKHPIF